MLLSAHPEALKQLRDEHDRVCGLRTDGAVALLRDASHRTAELKYTTAVLKETLRMYPVGWSARTDDKDNGLMTYNGHSYPTNSTMVVPAGHLIGHDETIYPKPGSFFPTRWLPSSPYPKIPRDAFRAFELGPRACMGRELALDEMRAVLLLTVRWFDFEVAKDTELGKPRATPRLDWFDLDTKVGDVAFQELALEAKPREGMRMTAKRTGREF
jgi:cytochrome P450